jgi:hypothetical protein
MKLADLESLATDLRTLADRLTSHVNDAKALADPFAAHYFVARREYRWAVDRSGKSGSKIERAVLSSYKTAMTLGFKGSIREWEDLLCVRAH